MPRYSVTETDIAHARLELALSGRLNEEAYRKARCFCDVTKKDLADTLLAGYLNTIHVAQGGRCPDDMEPAPYPLLISDVRRSIRDQLDEMSVTDVIDVLEELRVQPGMPETFEFSDEALEENAPVHVILTCIVNARPPGQQHLDNAGPQLPITAPRLAA